MYIINQDGKNTWLGIVNDGVVDDRGSLPVVHTGRRKLALLQEMVVTGGELAACTNMINGRRISKLTWTLSQDQRSRGIVRFVRRATA